MRDDFLRVYLNDHLAGAQAGLQLARDCLDHNPTGPISVFLSELVAEIAEDEEVLKDVYGRVHSTENPAKKAATWLLSKMGRMKLEDAFGRYTDLTRLEELEGLVVGIRGKLALWTALEAACRSDGRFSDVDFQALQERARRQHDLVENHRLEAARKAFVPDVANTSHAS